MKPLVIHFQAFGPYCNMETVDFEKLSKQGLFLICGETGSGKTTILDAITFALYGKSSGGMRDQLEAMRCKKSEWGVDTFVEYDFELQGRTYRFERKLECKKVKLSASQNVYLKNEEGVFEPLFENCKERDVNAKAKELIGLDYDQFRQVIILPQGQFEKLLTSNSDEKEKILGSIFGVNKWQKIANYFYDRVSVQRNQLIKIKEQVEIRLKDEQCESIEMFEGHLQKLQDNYVQRKGFFEEADFNGQSKRLEEKRGLAKQYETLKKQYQDRSSAEQKLKEEIEKTALVVADAEKQLEEHAREKHNIVVLQEEIIRLEEKRPYYLGLQEKQNYVEEQNKLYQSEQKKLNQTENDCTRAQKLLLRISEEYKKLRENYMTLSEQFLSGIIGNLASNLSDGMPCPVCGSTEHPVKAKPSDVVVTEQQVKEQEKKMHQKFDEIERAQKNHQDLLKHKEERECICAERKNKVLLAEKDLENAKKNLAEGIDSVRELERLIADYRKTIQEYQRKAERLEAGLKAKTDTLISLQARVSAAQEETRTAQTNLEKMKEAPDLNACEQEIRKLVKTKENTLAELARIQLSIQQKQEKLKLLKELAKEYTESWTQVESNWALAKNLRGDTGIGLQRYVLGIMFSSVISAANQMLEKVHGGRYRLFRSDEKGQGSNKKGLELKVFDSFSKEGDEGRSVKTLSGGEKFLVSLALSIGMSTIAQRSGTYLDAMFIDEGFGSLDQNSIEDALEVLASIQKANGTVGIISHVQVLQDNIPTKLEIRKSREGSQIVANIG